MSLSGAEPAARGVLDVSDKLPRETESFAQAFSNKGAALDLPETLSLDSAVALPQTLSGDIVPRPPTSLPLASSLSLFKRHSLLSARSNYVGAPFGRPHNKTWAANVRYS